jgi:hypothetical protein
MASLARAMMKNNPHFFLASDPAARYEQSSNRQPM